MSAGDVRTRLAFIVSHPIQYYVPLYRRLAARADLEVRVFFTWHDASEAVLDRGFGAAFQWDIPLREGYAWERVPNRAHVPGTQSFWGLNNPELLPRVRAWRPDAVHITGYAWRSHLAAMAALRRVGIPVLFRGDSHLLDGGTEGLRWQLKRVALRRIFAWPSLLLYVGKANRAYYEAFGVPAERLAYCPHSIDVERFAAQEGAREAEAAEWRRTLGIGTQQRVLLFAGKFEARKRPVELMRAFSAFDDPRCVLIMLGDGELGGEIRRIAAASPERFRVLPFQNQSRMPVAYRLADVFVLPSAWGETWGLAVNEALACGRPVLVSDRVGCAGDAVDSTVGATFPADDWDGFRAALRALIGGDVQAMRVAARARARRFDIGETERALCAALPLAVRRPCA